MRVPSFSIAELMAIVAIVALDCLAIRATQGSLTMPYLLVGGSPMQIVLAIGLLLMLRRRRRMEKSLSFLVGFEIVGWISLLLYVDFCFRAPLVIDQQLKQALNPLLGATGSGPFSLPVMIYRILLVMVCLTVPQLTVASIAGWFSQQLWKRTQPETVQTHD